MPLNLISGLVAFLDSGLVPFFLSSCLAVLLPGLVVFERVELLAVFLTFASWSNVRVYFLAGGAVPFDLGGGLVGLVPLASVPLLLGGGFTGLPVPLVELEGGAGLVSFFGGGFGLVSFLGGGFGLVSFLGGGFGLVSFLGGGFGYVPFLGGGAGLVLAYKFLV